MSSTEPTAPSAPASAPGERTLLVAQPKLQRVDRLMVSDSDQTFISERSTQAYIRGGIVGAVSALATGALLWRRMAPSAAVALGATSGALMGLFGMASTLPQAIREGILFLPNSSPLKMSLFHVYVLFFPEKRRLQSEIVNVSYYTCITLKSVLSHILS